MSKVPLKPYLVAKDAQGCVRVTVRTTRMNSQGYPLVTSTLLENSFPTLTAARNYVRDQYLAEPGDIASK